MCIGRFMLLLASGRRYWPKVFRKASELPITFRGGGSDGVRGNGGDGGGGGYSVGGVTGVTGGTGGGSGRSVIGLAGGAVGGKCGSARLGHGYSRHAPRHVASNAGAFSRRAAAGRQRDVRNRTRWNRRN
jgi:hypothetical protein